MEKMTKQDYINYWINTNSLALNRPTWDELQIKQKEFEKQAEKNWEVLKGMAKDNPILKDVFAF